jgi:hypothetical protein
MSETALRKILVCLILLMVPLASPVQAAVLYTNISSNPPTSPGDWQMLGSWGPLESGSWFMYAMPFQPSLTQPFDYVDIAVLTSAGASVQLYSDLSGLPGTLLDSVSLPEGAGLISSAQSAVKPTLAAGTTYWLVLEPPIGFGATWFKNDTGYVDTIAVRQGGSSSNEWALAGPAALFGNVGPSDVLGAFTVNGEDASAVREPSTFGLLGIALISVLAGGRRANANRLRTSERPVKHAGCARP